LKQNFALSAIYCKFCNGAKHIGISFFQKTKRILRGSNGPADFSTIQKRRRSKISWSVAAKTFKTLGPLEKKIVFILAAVIIISSFRLAYNFWMDHTAPAPDRRGTLTEGVIGTPRYINPILAQTNEVDLDLARLIFSSLFRFDANGELKPDLAKEYSVSEDKKTYTIKIKDDVLWQNPEGKKEKLTSDDIMFTVKAIQNPSYKSPLRANLTGVELEKIDDYTINFSLKNPYEPFLQNLTFGILPSHIWQYINADNTHLAQYNIKPIGSGMYKLDKITKDKLGKIISVELAANNDYYGKIPYIEKVIFKFFKDQESLVEAINGGQIDATAYLGGKEAKLIALADFKNYDMETPRYFSVFFNQEKSKLLADKNIRLALNYLTDKNQLLEAAIGGNGRKIETPIPPVFKESTADTKIYKFDPSYAATILTNLGWIEQEDKFRIQEIKEKIKDAKTGKITERVKEIIPLEFTLTTGDSPEFKKIAETIQSQWQAGGVKVNLNFLKPADAQSAIKNRDYDALLFGEILNIDPDPYIFWHSSEAKDPGLNLALYANKNADKILEDARQEFDAEKRKELLAKFQVQVVDDAPAVFLFNPYFSYWMTSDLQGFDKKIIAMPADRFSDINQWYVKTKRVWKWGK
jgi:peptide/nickel transport system substrate-binding protein